MLWIWVWCWKKRIWILWNLGYFGAKFLLGYCYVNGMGTVVDKEKGLKLYNEAAGKNRDAQNLLELSYDKITDDLIICIIKLQKMIIKLHDIN